MNVLGRRSSIVYHSTKKRNTLSGQQMTALNTINGGRTKYDKRRRNYSKII